MFLGCESVKNNTIKQPQSSISSILLPIGFSTNIIKPTLIVKSLPSANNPQVIINPSLPNPLISLDNNGNLSYTGMSLSNYYVLQSTIALISWTNLNIFYNQTNTQISFNRNNQFFRLRVIPANSVIIIWNLSPITNNVSFINIYYGTNSNIYNNKVSLINNTNIFTITNLIPNITYYISLSVSDSFSHEGSLTSELIYNKDIILNMLNK